MPLSKEDQNLKKRYLKIVNDNCPRINNFNPQYNKLTISLNYLKKNEFCLINEIHIKKNCTVYFFSNNFYI